MKIREYAESDIDSVISLWQTCQLLVPWNNPEWDIERKLQVGRHLFLVGEQNHKIIATVMGGYEGHRGWINYLAVDPDYRRRGYGKAMMIEVEARIKKMGCPKINLQVRATNPDVIGFYQSLGFLNDNLISMGKRLHKDPPHDR